MTEAEDLLHFWFGDLTDGLADAAHRARWFQASEAFDRDCETRFVTQLEAARSGELEPWLSSPAGRLAFIVLCDQMPRNIYRGTADAFAWDALALEAARQGVESGSDRGLAWDERCFLYMPFEHSENLFDQHLAVGLFTHLRDESPKSVREVTGNYLRFAQQHRDVIVRFGRFPHRNDALGRPSSAEEIEYVQGSDGFGQKR